MIFGFYFADYAQFNLSTSLNQSRWQDELRKTLLRHRHSYSIPHQSQHDSKYKSIGIRDYGVNNIWRHTNSEDDMLVNDYYNELKYKDGVRPKVRRYERHVFESYPMGDFTLLERPAGDLAQETAPRCHQGPARIHGG